MVWFNIDDGFYDHPKVRSIPRRQRGASVGLWTLSGSWACRYLTDGLIPDYQVEDFGFAAKDADSLVVVRLWHRGPYECPDDHCFRVPDGQFGFHSWMTYQQTKEAVERKRADARKRMADRRRKDGAP